MEELAPTLLFWGHNLTARDDPLPKPLFLLDLDGTLIQPRSRTRTGKVREHSLNAEDWEWLRPDIPDLLAGLLREHCLVVVTNQNGHAFRVARVLAVMRALVAALADSAHLAAFVCTGKDHWRKPHTTVFEHYLLPRLPPGQRQLIYVGDAAGRPADFSDSDRALAYNMSLVARRLEPSRGLVVSFSTPQEYFWEEAQPPRTWRAPDPRTWLVVGDAARDPTLPLRGVRAVVLVGSPGSGKSTLAAEISRDEDDASRWQVLSSDLLGGPARLPRAIAAAAPSARLILDATSPSRAARAALFKALSERALPPEAVLVLEMTIPRPLIEHLVLYRERVTGTPRLPSDALRAFYKHYEAPREEEWQDYPGRVVRYPWHPLALQEIYFLQRLRP